MSLLKIISLNIFLVLFLNSCGPDSKDDKNDKEVVENKKEIVKQEATLYGEKVANLKYFTDDEYFYSNKDGKIYTTSGKVKFYLGKVFIGEISKIPADKKIFLTDILNLPRGDYTNKKLIKLIKMLQGLDETDPRNGGVDDEVIVLNKEKIENMYPFDEPKTLDDIDITVLKPIISLPTDEEVKKKIKDIYRKTNIIGKNKAPIADAGADKEIIENQQVNLDGSASSDSDGTIVKYEWYENNQLLSNEKVANINLDLGEHNITLKVTDDENETSKDDVNVTVKKQLLVNPGPVVSTDLPSDVNKKVSVTLDIINVSFNEDVKTDSLIESNFVFTPNIDFTLEDKTVNSVKIKLTNKLNAETSYKLKISNVKDLSDNINKAYSKDFMTKPNFYLAQNGETVKCEGLNDGDTFTLNIKGIDKTFTKITNKTSLENLATNNSSALSTTCISGLEDASELFANSPTFNEDIGSWDTSSVKTMREMFKNAKLFNKDLNYWNTSNVTSMHGMFVGALVFNGVIKDWDTSSVTSMFSMFLSAKAFNGVIKDWDTSSVTNISSMFYGAINFDQDIGSWKFPNVVDMHSMFDGAIKFNKNIGSWKFPNVSNMDSMFRKASAFNQDLSTWCVKKITSKPNQFDNDATLWTRPKPSWGSSAPACNP